MKRFRTTDRASTLVAALPMTGSSLTPPYRRSEAPVAGLATVLHAERQTLATRDALVLSQWAQATSFGSEHRALGKGWTASEAVARLQQ